MTQIRKKRIVIIAVEITCYTDYSEQFLTSSIEIPIQCTKKLAKDKYPKCEVNYKKLNK